MADHSPSSTDRGSRIAMYVAVACAVLVTASILRREFTGGRQGPLMIQSGSGELAAVENWQDLRQSGHRYGPEDAPVAVVIFGDYECPACRR